MTFEIFEHRADVGVRGRGATLEEAFIEGARVVVAVPFLPAERPSQGAESASLADIGQGFLGVAAASALHLVVPMAAPRTVWRIRLPDGSVVHCVLWERRPKTTWSGTGMTRWRGWRSSCSPIEAELVQKPPG